MDALAILEFAQDEREEHENEIQRRRMRVFRDRENPLEELSDPKFLRRFRISKETFRWLLDLISEDLRRPTRRNQALTPLLQLAIALRFYANGAFQHVTGDTCGVSQWACGEAIHRVTREICDRKGNFITFPETQAERLRVQQGFRDIAQFPGVIGALDGSHVPIANPRGINAQRFMNRKGYYSLNCQLVCDHELCFTNVVSRWYGSAHDSRIFEESRLCQRFRAGELQGILLGDPAYTCTRYMLTPVREPRNVAERNYIQAQRRTRGVIERAFGVWKRRFQAVGRGNTLRCSLQHNMAIIIATACLHTLAIRRNDPLPDDYHGDANTDAPRASRGIASS
ncbi:putative nuclease HARBI1 [Lineus longissimus]|uniref:putative nuclease HARBI1 n=1 Tax=Lineus longissimus TaxID=88925 RepID=UPI00315CF795